MSKIPKKAKRVFAGEIFDVYHWEQEMYDGTTETFEMLRRQDTVQIIPTDGEKIYLAHQEQPQFTHGPQLTFLGGRVDKGEEPLTAAKRELREEAGMEADAWELIKSADQQFKIEWRVHYFIARGCRVVGEQRLDAGEKIDVVSVGFDEFIDFAQRYGRSAKDLLSNSLRINRTTDEFRELKKKIFAS